MWKKSFLPHLKVWYQFDSVVWRFYTASDVSARRVLRVLLHVRLGRSRQVRVFTVTITLDRAIFVWPWKLVSISDRYLFYQPMDEKMKKKKSKKTRSLRFPAKGNPNMEKALFDWSVVLQYDVKAKNRLISRKFSGSMFFHPSVRLTNKKRISPWETSGKKRCL